jgi:hypothetical protein
MDHRVAKRSFGRVIVKRHIGMMKKDEQSGAMFPITVHQLLGLGCLHLLAQQGITIGFQLGHRSAIDDQGQLITPFEQALRAQQQLLHAVGPGRPFSVNRILKIAQLVSMADLI